MIAAIRHVHAGKGPWVTEGGYEYNLVMLAAIFALTEAGPGPVSLDDALGIERCGTAWAITQLAIGAVGSELISRMGGSPPAPEAVEAGGAAVSEGADGPIPATA